MRAYVPANDTHAVKMNQPSRADRFVLPEGERKLTFERDTKVENAGTFVLQREDHTLGNLLRMYVRRTDERFYDATGDDGNDVTDVCVCVFLLLLA